MIASPVGFDLIMAFILVITLYIAMVHKQIPRTHFLETVIIASIAILLMGLAPATETVGPDRPNYAYMFSHADKYIRDGYRDVGFTYYAKICDIITGSVTGAFLISAFIYVFATIYFYKKSCPRKYIYMVLLCFLSLGFTNHYYNVLRSGMSIALILIAVSKNQSKLTTAILSAIAVSFHVSGLLVVVGYLLTYKLKNTKILYAFWGGIFVALIIGIFDSFTQYLDLFSSMEDARLSSYLSGKDKGYKVGLRLDFIAYSFFPIIIGWYYIFRRNFKDEYYKRIYNTYLFCNACWLVISKMPFNDRLAYLSWVFIPYLLLYPILCSDEKNNFIVNRKILLFSLSVIVGGLNIFLKYIR